MTANDPTPRSGQESSGKNRITRRSFLGATAALAALPASTGSAAATADFAPPAAMDRAEVYTGEFTPGVMWTTLDRGVESSELADMDLDARNLVVSYNDCARVTVALEAQGCRARSSAWADLNPEQARALAAALDEAADELEARMEAERAPE